MKTKLFFTLSAIILAVFSSCSSSSSEEDAFLTVDVNQLYFEGQQGVSASLSIQSNAQVSHHGYKHHLLLARGMHILHLRHYRLIKHRKNFMLQLVFLLEILIER